MPPRSTPMTRWADKGVATIPGRMADGEKPYRVYKGGRTRGKVPTAPRPERQSKAENDRPEDQRPPALGPADRARRTPPRRAADRLVRARIPLVPRRRRRSEREAAEVGDGKPCAAGRHADLEAVADPAPGDRRRQAGRRTPVRLDSAPSNRPEPAPHVLSLDPSRPPRRDPGLRHEQGQRRIPARWPRT